MKLVLKNNWDIPINAPTEVEQRGYFIGRKQELNLLVNEISRKTCGAILVSGYRGVGKTSLAYKALWEVKSRDKNTIVVLLNASQLEAELDEPDQKIRPRSIIENLIRRLFSIVKTRNDLDKTIQEKINGLYRKTVATEFKLVETYQKAQEKTQESTQEELSEIFLSEQNIRTIFFLSSWIIALFLQFVPLNTKFILLDQFLNKALPLLLMLPIPFGINLLYRRRKEKREVEKMKIATGELYEFDDSIGNLEFDLEEIHRELRKAGKKLVYIIDELDKLEVKDVVEVLKFFKNLFTLSDAVFVFVGGEEIFNIGLQREANIFRDKAYTYFTSRYFLSRPFWADLNSFLDSVIEEKKGVDTKSLEILKRSICFKAKNDFFDLKKFIKDRINNFSTNNLPMIETQQLSDDDIKEARLHKAIMALFEDKYLAVEPSKWEENEAILRKLFDHTHLISLSYSGLPVNDPDQEAVEDAALRDFNSFLERLGALNRVNETSKTLRGIQVSVRNYSYTGSIPTDPPKLFKDNTEFEKRFVSAFKIYNSYILSLINTFRRANKENELSEESFWQSPKNYAQQINNWGFDALSLFDTQWPVYQEILKHNYAYKRDDIEQRTAQLSAHIKTLLDSLPTIISRILLQLNASLQAQGLKDNGSLFSGTTNEIRNALQNYNHIIIFKPDLSRQLLIVNNQYEVIMGVRKYISDNAKTHKVICVIEDMKREKIRGLHTLQVKDPQRFKNNMVRTLEIVTRFLS